MPETYKDKYRELTRGMTTAVFNKLGGMSGAARFLAGEMTPQEFFSSWHEDEGIIYLSLFSFGTPIDHLIGAMEGKKIYISDRAKDALRKERKELQPTFGQMFTLAIVKTGSVPESMRTLEKIRNAAALRVHTPPTSELACLMRNAFSTQEINNFGLRWIGFNTPAGSFVLNSLGLGGCQLDLETIMREDELMNDEGGIAYVSSCIQMSGFVR